MILEVSSVNQAFRTGFWMRRVQILFDVSLHVPERSIFGFLGANGAGKTTLIHLIAGLHRPTSGSVRVAGFDATSSKARAKIGYLPERPYFYEHLTGEQFLTYFGRLSGHELLENPGSDYAGPCPRWNEPGSRRRASQVLEGHASAYRYRSGDSA